MTKNTLTLMKIYRAIICFIISALVLVLIFISIFKPDEHYSEKKQKCINSQMNGEKSNEASKRYCEAELIPYILLNNMNPDKIYINCLLLICFWCFSILFTKSSIVLSYALLGEIAIRDP